MRRLQAISEFSHSLGRDQPREQEARRRYPSSPPGIPICARKYRDFAMYPSRLPDPGVVSEYLLGDELRAVIFREEPIAMQQFGQSPRLGNGTVAQYDDAVAAPHR